MSLAQWQTQQMLNMWYYYHMVSPAYEIETNAMIKPTVRIAIRKL